MNSDIGEHYRLTIIKLRVVRRRLKYCEYWARRHCLEQQPKDDGKAFNLKLASNTS